MIHVGDCLDILPTLPERSVHCVVTSPPYFGLRDYGTAKWDGGDPACDHGEAYRAKRQAGRQSDVEGGVPGSLRDKPVTSCKCGARRIDSQIGLEPTPDAFVAAMVRVFREVKRVLRDDGTCFLNLGDSYGPNKQELMIPHRVAMALQADGWICRSTIIWAKTNAMPESVRDRPTKSHEYMFLLSKSPRYYWDAEAVREPACEATLGRNDRGRKRHQNGGGSPESMSGDSKQDFGDRVPTAGRNIRSVWTLPTKSFRGAHFATFPPRLVEPCIKAGTSEMGCCPGCGKPWVRVVERDGIESSGPNQLADKSRSRDRHAHDSPLGDRPKDGYGDLPRYRMKHLGWRPDCTCGTERPIPEADLEADPTLIDDFEIEPFPPVPCTVLDPFAGAGTVGLVAKQLGRSFLGCELNPDYAAMAGARIAKGA